MLTPGSQRRIPPNFGIGAIEGMNLHEGMKRLIGITLAPRPIELPTDEGLLFLGQVVQDVPSLVDPASLDETELAEHLLGRGPQTLAAV